MKQQPERVAAFLEGLRVNVGEQAVGTAANIVEWAHAQGMRDAFFNKLNYHGEHYCPVIPGIPEWDPSPLSIADLRGDVWVEADNLSKRPPFKQDLKFEQLLERAHAVPGMEPKERIPHISLEALADDTVWTKFIGLMDWVVGQIKRFN